MAEKDLDVVIRQIAKQQTSSLMAAAKARHAHYMALAGKAKSKDSKERLKQVAKNTLLLGTAAAKRLRMSAENAADSYARAMRNAADTQPAKKPVKTEQKARTEPQAKAKPVKTKPSKTKLGKSERD
jgi:hypothetical protein